MSGMLPVPNSIKVGPLTYPVRWKRWKKKTGKCGETHLVKQTIAVREGLSLDRMSDTLLHEALHCMLAQMGYENDNEEWVVTALAPLLLQLLRDNPETLEYILHKEG